jgi:hypothetical protein
MRETVGRRDASPRQRWGGASAAEGVPRASAVHGPRTVGVRRCLTRLARRAGRPPPGPVGHLPCRSPPGGMCHGIPRAIRRGRARQRLAPTGAGRPIPGRAQGHHRDARPPFVVVCRGQALPDPPARQGRPTGPALATAVEPRRTLPTHTATVSRNAAMRERPRPRPGGRRRRDRPETLRPPRTFYQ